MPVKKEVLVLRLDKVPSGHYPLSAAQHPLI
jgi:hypothetical protein